MTNYGYLKVCAASPRMKLADPLANAEILAGEAQKAAEQGAGIILFPELALTGCSCGDLFLGESLQEKTGTALEKLLEATAELQSVIVVGLPAEIRGRLVNCAAVLQRGRLAALVPKQVCSPAESRWFVSGAELAPCGPGMAGPHGPGMAGPHGPGMPGGPARPEAPFGGPKASALAFDGPHASAFAFDGPHAPAFDAPVGNFLFTTPGGFTFAIEFGSDANLPMNPAAALALNGAQLILCPAADPVLAGSEEQLLRRITAESKRLTVSMAYASAGPWESTSDFVYSGQCLAAENGDIVACTDTLNPDGTQVITELDLGLMKNLKKHSPVQPCPPCPVIGLDFPGGEIKALSRSYSKAPFLEKADTPYCRRLLEIQAAGLAQRMKRAYSKKAIIGVSGGSDSTLAILVAARAVAMLGMPQGSVLAITMPGFGTTDRTKGNAYGLMESLGCQVREISIAANAKAHLEDIGHDMSVHNVAYENAQARERTQVLMDLANDVGGLVVGTGDMSETALGWCTYGGDHLSMYSVNGGLTKGMVKAVIAAVSADIKAGVGPFAALAQAERLAAALDDVLDTPVSPELLPPDADGKIAQITEDKVGPYELHDFYLWHMVFLGKSREKTAWLAKQVFAGDYDAETVDKWLATFCRRFSSQQFKRDCAPGGPQAADFSFSPRGGWLMPSDASGELWK